MPRIVIDIPDEVIDSISRVNAKPDHVIGIVFAKRQVERYLRSQVEEDKKQTGVSDAVKKAIEDARNIEIGVT